MEQPQATQTERTPPADAQGAMPGRDDAVVAEPTWRGAGPGQEEIAGHGAGPAPQTPEGAPETRAPTPGA